MHRFFPPSPESRAPTLTRAAHTSQRGGMRAKKKALASVFRHQRHDENPRPALASGFIFSGENVAHVVWLLPPLQCSAAVISSHKCLAALQNNSSPTPPGQHAGQELDKSPGARVCGRCCPPPAHCWHDLGSRGHSSSSRPGCLHLISFLQAWM